jgi:hypothetical protein
MVLSKFKINGKSNYWQGVVRFAGNWKYIRGVNKMFINYNISITAKDLKERFAYTHFKVKQLLVNQAQFLNSLGPIIDLETKMNYLNAVYDIYADFKHLDDDNFIVLFTPDDAVYAANKAKRCMRKCRFFAQNNEFDYKNYKKYKENLLTRYNPNVIYGILLPFYVDIDISPVNLKISLKVVDDVLSKEDFMIDSFQEDFKIITSQEEFKKYSKEYGMSEVLLGNSMFDKTDPFDRMLEEDNKGKI